MVINWYSRSNYYKPNSLNDVSDEELLCTPRRILSKKYYCSNDKISTEIKNRRLPKPDQIENNIKLLILNDPQFKKLSRKQISKKYGISVYKLKTLITG